MRGKLLLRGATRRCPRCGEWSIFNGYFRMKDECPRCGLDLKREEGYYVGGMTVNIGMAELLAIFFIIVAVIWTWPDIPVWTIVGIGVGFNLLFPIVFYPITKTFWLAFDLAFLNQIDHEDVL